MICNLMIKIMQLVDQHRANTQLLLAAENGHTKIVSQLLANGANVLQKTFRYQTSALFLASENADAELVRLLLENGADTMIEDRSYLSGLTVLMYAILNKNTEIVKLLLNFGAALDPISYAGKNALDYARRDELPEIIEAIEETQAKRLCA